MELGYTIYPPANTSALGHPRLDVNLYTTPTGRHFDPRELILSTCTPDRGVTRLKLSHPVETGEYQVCVGRIILVNFSGDELEAFTFGGKLKITNEGEYSHCQLVSPAPIFDLGRFSQDELALVSKYESQLAILKAGFQNNDLAFEGHLAQIDPRTLFIALTAEIEQRMKLLPVNARAESYWKFRHSLHSAILFVDPEGELPSGSPTIQDLFFKN